MSDRGDVMGREAPRVVLHVTHALGGGVEHWIRTFCGADPTSRHLVLRARMGPAGFGEALALHDAADLRAPLRTVALVPPIVATDVRHPAYARALASLVREFHVEGLVVSSLVGHSLDALEVDLPTVVACHDYYPWCPAITIAFEGVCGACDDRRLARCLATHPWYPHLRRLRAEGCRAVREGWVAALARRRLPVVVPTRSVQDHLAALDPRVAVLRFHVVPYGRAPAPRPLAGREGRPDEDGGALRVLVLGRLEPSKGSVLLARALPALEEMATVYLLGTGPGGLAFRGRGRSHVIPSYRREDLPRLAAALRPEIGVLASVCPETFSYTLSELFELGVPPLVTNLGAFAERVQEGVNGFRFEPRPEALVERVRWLCDHREALAAVRTRLPGQPSFALDDMVDRYRALLR